MRNEKKALLVLENGSVYNGISGGADGEVLGEICFNTSMTGYQEILTDPSYAGQLITFTLPHIGNTGINPDDNESRSTFSKGLIVRSLIGKPSSWRSTESLPEFLIRENIVTISEIDTRKLVREIREGGAMRAIISTVDSDKKSLLSKVRMAPYLGELDLVESVAYGTPYTFDDDRPEELLATETGYDAAFHEYNVVAFDTGIKYNILRSLSRLGCRVTVVPPTTSASEVLALSPDGIFLGNGPGDPEKADYLADTIKELLGVKPLFGICLGHQMLSLAAGASIYKLKFGHRGSNHPVKNLETGTVEISSQNHGYCTSITSLITESSEKGPAHEQEYIKELTTQGTELIVESKGFGPLKLTHVSLNDFSVEGIELIEQNAFSVQFHPEAAAGPHDCSYLFEKFISLMQASKEG